MKRVQRVRISSHAILFQQVNTIMESKASLLDRDRCRQNLCRSENKP